MSTWVRLTVRWPDVVEQASRSRDEHFDAGEQLLGLRLDRHAAVDDRVAQRHVLAVGAEAVVDLDGQLARRRQDQRAHRMASGREAGVGVRGQALEHRQRKGCGLAGAGLGAAHQVAPAENEGDRLILDRGGYFVALLADGAQDFRAEPEGVEGQLFLFSMDATPDVTDIE